MSAIPDLGERERTEAERRETWALTSAALEATVETVALYRPVLDPDGRLIDAEIVFANSIARRRWLGGASQDEIRGRRLFERWPALRGLIFDLYAWIVESNEPFRGIREFETPAGPRKFDLAITPFEGGLVHVGRDVTDEQRGVEALRESEERLRRTIEGVDAIVSFQERGGAPVLLSPQVDRILGYRADQIRDFETWNSLVHPDDLERCKSAWSDLDSAWELEYRIRRQDGRWIWVSDHGRRVSRPNGGAPGMFGVVVDVTAQREAAERVRESEARFRAVFEENPETIGLCRPVRDADGRFVDAALVLANRQARDRYLGGISADAVAGSHLFERWPELRPLLFGAAASVVDRGEPFRGEIGANIAGTELWSDMSLFPFEDGFAFVGRDVTERKRAELALRRSESRYRAVADSAADAIVTMDPAGTIVEWNLSAERMFDYATDDIVGRPVRTLVPDTIAGDFAGALREFQDGRGRGLVGRTVEMRGRRRDGTEFPIELSLADWTVESGRFATAIIRDISGRKQAEEDLRLADARLRRFFDANIIGTVVAEAGGRVLEANDYWLALTGYSRDELERGEADWRVVTAPEFLAADDEAIAVLRERGHDTPYEKEYLRRDGTRVPALIVRATMPGPGEQFASFVLDTTAQREATAGLARLVAAIEQTSDSVVITDPGARIVYVNPAFERVTGYDRSEVLGQNPRILNSGVQPSAFYQAMWETLTRGATWHGELVNRSKDGRQFIEDASISPVRDASGAVTAYVAVKRDITAQRELEDRLRQSQRLEAIGQLAGGVAHDFNNLLAAIRGYGELAQAALPAGSQGRGDIDEVLRAADRAAALTRQLLTFSRSQALASDVLDPSAIIEGLAPMLRRLLGEHIELVTSHAPDLGRVRFDPSQLEQVIVNLAVNARDAMPDGGRLAIEMANVELEEEEDVAGAPVTPAGPGVRIRVSDTGAGMEEAVTARIFEPFFTTKAPGKGTGMGLATVYGIVGASGGRISVASTPGVGTTFTIDLPRVDDPAAPTAEVKPAPAPSSAGSGTILLVEDDGAVRSVATRFLTGLGYTVLAAASGPEALELLTSVDVSLDLLVTDVRMPGMQGPDLAKRVRAARPDVPVLFMSGYAEEMLAGLTPGTAGVNVLDKPFDAQTLGRAVRAAIDGPR